MSNRSPYIDNVVLTKKHSGKRTHKVQAFVIHHMAAKWTGKRCAEYFRDTPSRQASANYCIGYDGDVALNVEEGNRAWTSSSAWADNRAITYELGNSKTGHPWEVSDKTLNKLIVMLAEQHKRYGIKKASYTGDTSGTLWRHDWFASTNCPGPYLGGKLSYIANEVNKILSGKESAPAPSKPSTSKPASNNAKPSTKATPLEVAKEIVSSNKWGNGDTRKRKLQAAGYDYNEVQGLVNDIVYKRSTTKPKKKSAEQVAQDIANGRGGWGNDPERSRKLNKAGYNAASVQRRVNEILRGSKPKPSSVNIESLAKQVVRGVDTKGRRIPNGVNARAKHFGISVATMNKVQKRVNQLLS